MPTTQWAHRLNLQKRLLTGSLTCLFLLTQSMIASARADVTMKNNFKEFVPIVIETAASTNFSEPREPFEVTLSDNITYKNKTIPKGTHLEGTIQETRHSKRFGRPARFKVCFDKLVLSNEQTLPLRYEGLAPKKYTAIFLKNNRDTYQSFFSRQVLISTAANAISIPIGLTVKGGIFMALAFDGLVDGTVGTTQEVLFKSPNDTRSKTHRALYGFFRGSTPFPFLYGMGRKHPELEYDTGTPLYLRFPKSMWQYIFTQI